MNYYETIAGLIKWDSCQNNQCRYSTNYNGVHSHKHVGTIKDYPITYQIWDEKHNSINITENILQILEDIDDGRYK